MFKKEFNLLSFPCSLNLVWRPKFDLLEHKRIGHYNWHIRTNKKALDIFFKRQK